MFSASQAPLPLGRPGLPLPGGLRKILACQPHETGCREWVSKVPEAKEQKRWPPRQHGDLGALSGELGNHQVSTQTQTFMCSVPDPRVYGPFRAKACGSVPGHRKE